MCICVLLQVTGGARGIGRAISIELAKCGCNIAIADVDLPSAKDCCEELHLLGVKAFPYQVRDIFACFNRLQSKIDSFVFLLFFFWCLF